ncbi:O-antigen ligase family protein [Halobacillus faecis]
MNLILFFLISVISYFFPVSGLILASQSYLIRISIQDGSSVIISEESDLLLGLILPLLIFALIIIKERSRLVEYSVIKMDLLLILLGVVLTLGVLYAPDHIKASETVLRYFGLGISFYFFLRLQPHYNKEEYNRTFTQFIYSFWSIGIILSIIAFTNPNETTSRLSPGLAHPVPFSFLIGVAVIVSVYILLSSRSTLFRVLSFFSFFFLIFVLFSTNTRGTIIASFLSVLFIFSNYLLKRELSIKISLKILLLLTCIFIGAVLALQTKPQLFNNIISKFSSLFEENIDASAQARTTAFNKSLSLFQENPVWGSGTASFSSVSQMEYPHNLFLEILGENGLVGFCVLILTIIYMLYWIYVSKKIVNQNQRVVIIGLLIYCFIEAQVSLTLWMNKVLFMTIALFINLLVVKGIEEKKRGMDAERGKKVNHVYHM